METFDYVKPSGKLITINKAGIKLAESMGWKPVEAEVKTEVKPKKSKSHKGHKK